MSRPTAARPARRVAVVGSGVAGLTAAWVLQRSAEVTLYEADDRLGGHAHTHDLLRRDGSTVAVDTGFIVHNERTYPTLLRLFAELDVATQPSDMSMSVRCDGCGLEYAGARGLAGLLATPRSLARPKYLRMLSEVLRFQRQARALLADESDQQVHPGAGRTLAQFLATGGFSDYFVAHFMTPVVAAVWSCPPGTALDYPARYLFAFLANHGMLSVTGSPPWKTVSGGSRSYVEKVAKELSAVHTTTPVRAVVRTGDGVRVRDDADTEAAFDAVVVATHPHQALDLLADPTPAQRELLGAMPYSVNTTLLHSDASVLARAPRARASWNYRMAACRDAAEHVRVTYDMNRLQGLAGPDRYLVTLGDAGSGEADIPVECILDTMVYEHPVYTPTSVAAQARLSECDDERLAFAGAYRGWGFHEDGCASGVAAARRIGGTW